MEQKFESFEDLNAYKMAIEIRQKISAITKKFPKEEEFKLKDQLLRSSRSVTATIAEGHGRHYFKDNMRFCIMARGSLNETIDHLSVAFEENYIDEAMFNEMRNKINLNIKVLNGYLNYLKKLHSAQS